MIYIIFSYLFILGTLLENDKKISDSKVITTLLFSPIMLPMFLEMVFTKYYNEGKNQQNE